MTTAHRYQSVVDDNHEIKISGLPLEPGQAVEVFIVPRTERRKLARGSMKGSVRRYDRPFDPVIDIDAWEANP